MPLPADVPPVGAERHQRQWGWKRSKCKGHVKSFFVSGSPEFTQSPTITITSRFCQSFDFLNPQSPCFLDCTGFALALD